MGSISATRSHRVDLVAVVDQLMALEVEDEIAQIEHEEGEEEARRPEHEVHVLRHVRPHPVEVAHPRVQRVELPGLRVAFSLTEDEGGGVLLCELHVRWRWEGARHGGRGRPRRLLGPPREPARRRRTPTARPPMAARLAAGLHVHVRLGGARLAVRGLGDRTQGRGALRRGAVDRGHRRGAPPAVRCERVAAPWRGERGERSASVEDRAACKALKHVGGRRSGVLLEPENSGGLRAPEGLLDGPRHLRARDVRRPPLAPGHARRHDGHAGAAVERVGSGVHAAVHVGERVEQRLMNRGATRRADGEGRARLAR